MTDKIKQSIIPHQWRNKYGHNAGASFASAMSVSGGGNSSGGNGSTSGSNINLTPHKIFGQDGNYAERDITGNIDVSTLIAQDASIANTLKVGGTTNLKGDTDIDGNVDVDGSMTVSGDFNGVDITLSGDINAVNASISNTLTANDVNCDNVNCSDTITTHILDSDSISNKNKITTKELDASTIKSTTINNTDTITTKNLEVTGSAHFFELIIDKIKSAGGAAMFTPADGFAIDKIIPIKYDDMNRYRLYWKNTDENGNYRANMWQTGDQALCRSFNQATSGSSKDVSNKYYWCYVCWTSNDESNYEDDYNFIDIVDDENGFPVADGVVNPEIGDNIVMCGHRKYGLESEEDATRRGSAIYIASYAGLDSELKSPFIAQYRGIKTFDLTPYRQSYFDATGAKFIGDFEITPDQLTEIANQVDVHDPYINDDGYWVIWKDGSWFTTEIKAEGTSVSITSTSVTYQIGDSGTTAPSGTWQASVPTLVKGKYLWTKTVVNYSDGKSTTTYSVSYIGQDGTTPVKGVDYTDGNDSVVYKLLPVVESATVDTDENLKVQLQYIAYQQKGNDTPVEVTQIVNPDYFYIQFKDNKYNSYTGNAFANSYLNNTYKTKYYTNKLTDLTTLTVELVKNNKVYDSRTVPVVFNAGVVFEINQAQKSIDARITETNTLLGQYDDDVKTYSNQVSGFRQDVQGFNTTVAQYDTTVQGYNNAVQGYSSQVANFNQTVQGFNTTVENVNSNYTGVQTRLSEVEQTAEGLTTTVSKLNKTGVSQNYLTGSDFSGHIDKSMYFIDGGINGNYLVNGNVSGAYNNSNYLRIYINYGNTKDVYNGVRWGSSNKECIRLKEGKKYTLSVWAKSNVTGTQKLRFEIHKHATLLSDNRVSGQSAGAEFTLTTSWKQYTFDFTAYTFNEIYIFAYNSWSRYQTHDISICMPMLSEEGIVDWSPAPSDYSRIQGNMLSNTSTFVKSGNVEIYTYDSKWNFSEIAGTKVISKTIGTDESYAEMGCWLMDNNVIKPNTDYVLSFYAMDPNYSSTNKNTIWNYLYNGSNVITQHVDDIIGTSKGVTTDGNNEISITGDWKRYYTHWRTSNSIPSSVRVLIRLTKGTAYIAAPKLEQGCTPSDYTDKTDLILPVENLQSQIIQTASEIKLSVSNDLKTTGIDIINGQITLDADNTTINGNLQLQGLVHRKPMHITSENINDYVEYQSGRYVMTTKFWSRCGGYVIFDNGCFSNLTTATSFTIYFPSIYYNGSVIQKDMARELVGNNVTIYNQSGKSMLISGAVYTEMGSDGLPNFSSSYFGSGYVCNFYCEFMACNYNGGLKETICWYKTLTSLIA